MKTDTPPGARYQDWDLRASRRFSERTRLPLCIQALGIWARHWKAPRCSFHFKLKNALISLIFVSGRNFVLNPNPLPNATPFLFFFVRPNFLEEFPCLLSTYCYLLVFNSVQSNFQPTTALKPFLVRSPMFSDPMVPSPTYLT